MLQPNPNVPKLRERDWRQWSRFAKPNWVEEELRKFDPKLRLKRDFDGYWWVTVYRPDMIFDGIPDTAFVELWRCEWYGMRRQPDDKDIAQAHRCRRSLVEEHRTERAKEFASKEREAENRVESLAKDNAHCFSMVMGWRHRYVRGTKFDIPGGKYLSDKDSAIAVAHGNSNKIDHYVQKDKVVTRVD